MADQGSTVPRRQLGRHLRELRENTQMAPRVAAEALEVSVSTLHRLEGGQTSARAIDVEAMCRLYGAPADLTEALMGLARETKARGWWHAYGDAIPRWFQVYVGLEGAAVKLRKYEPDLVPGLLQTKKYATAILRLDDTVTAPDEIERRVSVRLERQALLFRRIPPAPRLDVVLGEAALRRSPEDHGAMADQLRYLNEAGVLPNVSIRVLPLSAGLHRAAGTAAFTILSFPTDGNGRQSEPPIVYSGLVTGAVYLDRGTEVAAYDSMWAAIEAVTLDESQSRTLISQIAEEFDKHA